MDDSKVDGGPSLGLACQSNQLREMASAHRHDDIEFNLAPFPISYLLDGRLVTIPSGTIACFWAARPHQLRGDRPNEVFFWLTVPLSLFLSWRLPPTFVGELLGEASIGTSSWPTLADPSSLFEQWSIDLATRDASQGIAQLEIEAFVRRIAQSGLTEVSRAEPTQGTSAAATEMARFVSEHFAGEVRVEDIARHVHLHPQYAMALFRRTMGRTLGEYLSHSRISHAQRLLITTSIPIADVAVQCGFSSISAFYDRFNRECGTSPGQYRRSFLNQAPQESDRTHFSGSSSDNPGRTVQ